MNTKLNNLVNECIKELDNIGVYYGKITEFKVNARFKNTWGRCSKDCNNNTFTIMINKKLLQNGSDFGIKQTIIHEMIHTVDGCFNHKAKWKQIADYVNSKYNYNVKRTNTSVELGFKEDDIKADYKYVFKCEKCGQLVCGRRKSKFTVNYKRFRCSKEINGTKCFGTFEKIK